MTKLHATPEEFRTYIDPELGEVTRSWGECFNLAIQSLSSGVHDRGILELSAKEYLDPVPFHVVVDRKVDIQGKGGGFRCSLTLVHGSFEFQRTAAGSRISHLGIKSAAVDAIKTVALLELEQLHITGANGWAVAFDGAAVGNPTNNCNGSYAHRVLVEECAAGGFYAFGADAGVITFDQCWVLGLTGGNQVGPTFTNRASAEAYAAQNNLHVAQLQRFNPTDFGCFDKPEAVGFKYEGANTIHLTLPFCEWAGRPQPGVPGDNFEPNTRGFFIAPNGGGAKVDLAHDESGGLPAQIHGTVSGGNFARTLERVPGRSPPLRMIGFGDVGAFTMHLKPEPGGYRGAIQFAPNGTSHCILYDAEDRGVVVAPSDDGKSVEWSRTSAPAAGVPFMRMPTEPGSLDRLVLNDGVRLTSDVFVGPRIPQWEYRDGGWYARVGTRPFGFAQARSPYDELACDKDGNLIDGGIYYLEDDGPPPVGNLRVGQRVYSSASNPTVSYWQCVLERIQDGPNGERRWEKRMKAYS